MQQLKLLGTLHLLLVTLALGEMEDLGAQADQGIP
jgi:hypothetical protein